MNNDWREYYDPEYVLIHHGIKGQKWGIRKYQNADGTLTAEGKQRYGAASGKVEKYSRKASGWESRAINAKTSIGRGLSTSMATWRRQKADRVAEKATGDYKLLALNKNAARNLRAGAETNANIAAGIKKRADNSTGLRNKYLMEKAVQKLASAENHEIAGKKYEAVSKSPLLLKGGTYITKTLKESTYTGAGRQRNVKERVAEALGDQVISSIIQTKTKGIEERIDSKAAESASSKKAKLGSNAAKLGIKVANKVAGRGVVSGGRDVYYRSQNSAQKRWDKIAKG